MVVVGSVPEENYMNKCYAGILCILLGLSTIQGQISLVSRGYIADECSVFNENQVLAVVDDHNLIVSGQFRYGEGKSHVVLLDESRTNGAHYFVLYNKGRYRSHHSIKRYGTILMESTDALIFKSSTENLRAFDSFDSYEIVMIDTTPLVGPCGSSYLPKKYNFNPNIETLVKSVSIDTMWQRIAVFQKMEKFTDEVGTLTTVDMLKQYLSSFDVYTVSTHTWRNGSAPNIIAEMKGSESPNDIVIVGAHFDSVKKGYPAADDNGSGTCATLELARLFSKCTFKKTIRFVLFSGEEIGLLGSKAYVKEAKQKGENIIAYYNIDMISYLKQGDPLFLDVCHNSASATLFQHFRSAVTRYLPGINVCDAKDTPWKMASDHASFWNNGYKALYFGDDLDPNGPPHPCYHKLGDTIGFGANSPEMMETNVKAITAAFAETAELDKITTLNPITKVVNYSTFIQRKDDRVYITSDKRSMKEFTLLDPSGRQILKGRFNKRYVISLKFYTRGVYLLKVKDQKSIRTEKMVIW